MSEIDVQFSREAKKFLAKNTSVISEEESRNAVIAAVRKTLREESNNADVKRLQGKYKGAFRVRVGNVRIVYTVRFGIVRVASVSTIGFRGSVY